MADETDEASFGLREFQGGHPRAGDRPQDITTNRHTTRYSRRRGGSPAAVSIAAAVTVQAQAGYGRGREARPRAGCSRRRGRIAEGVGGFTARQRTFGSLAFGLSFLLSSRSFEPRSFAFWHFGSGCFAFGLFCSPFFVFELLWVPALSPFAFFFSCSFTLAGSQGLFCSPGPQVSRALVSRLFSCEVNRPRQWTEGRCPSAKQVSSVERGSRRAPSEKPSIPE